MKSNIKYLITVLLISFLWLSGREVKAQADNFELSIRDVTQTASNVLEFNIYLLDTDAGNDFYLSTEQFGILFNSAIYGGGTMSASIDNSTSELGTNQLMTVSPSLETNAAYPGQTLIKFIGPLSQTPLAQCSLISTVSPGTLVTHIVLENTTGDFVSGTTPDFEFTSSTAATPLWATSLTRSDGATLFNLTVSPGVNAIVPTDENPELNSLPDAAGTISGTASVCRGTAGVSYSVAAIDNATSYSWSYSGTGIVINNGTTNSITIDFGASATSGNLTVYGSNDNGDGTVSEPYAITVNPLPVTSDISGNASPACSGTGYTYSVTNTAGSSYSWTVPSGAQITEGAGTNSITVSFGETSGNITVTETSSAGCVGTPKTLAITLAGCGLTADFTGAPLATCTGSTVTFTDNSSGTSGSTTYSWNFGSGATPPTANTAGPHNVTYSTVGSKTVSLTVTDGIESTETKTGYITVSAVNTITLTSGTGTNIQSICLNEDINNITYSTTGATGATFSGLPNGVTGIWSANIVTISGTPTASGNFSYTVTLTGGCGTVTANGSITVNQLPTTPIITPSGSVSVCAGSAVTLTSSTAAGYLWSTGATTQSIIAGTDGVYTVQVRNVNNCWSPVSAATTVTVNPLPTAPTITASGPTSFCTGGSVTLTSSLSSGYFWSTGATTRSISVSNAGNYWVRVTDANGCQSPQSAVTAVTVYPLPSAPSIVSVTQPTCELSTGSVVLGGLPAGSWTVNPGSITGSTTTVTVSGLVAGSHTFTVTNSNGCTSEESAEVVINTSPASPTAPVVGTVTQPTCAVSTGSVGFSGLPSTGIWTLTRSPGGATTTGTGGTYTLNGVPSGTWTFTVTNASGCISPSTAQVIINDPLPLPAAPVVSIDCSAGAGNALVTVTTPTGTGYSYRLDGGTFQETNVFTSVANGDHTVTVRNSSGCTTTGPLFSVNCGCANPPTVTLSATSGNTCGTVPVTVSGNSFGGSATSVTITENGAGSVNPTASTSPSFGFTYTPAAADAGRIVTVTVTTNNPLGLPCSAASATYTLTVNAIPVAPTTGTVTQPSCAQPTGSVILSNLPASGEWTIAINPGGQTVKGTGTTTTITGLAPGTYTFTVTSEQGCVSASSSSVIINAQPDTPAAPVIGTITHPTCGTSTGSVELTGLPATGTWTITRYPGTAITTGSGTSRTISGLNSGTYSFTVTNASGCVSASSEDAVINPQPATPSAPVVGAITQPTCAEATGSVELDGLPEEGEWILTRYPGSITTTGSGTSTSVSQLATGTYNFSVQNAAGCSSSVSGNVVISAQPPTPSAPVIGTITHPTYTVSTGSVALSGLPSTGTWTLTWYPDGLSDQGSGTTFTVSGLEPGTYTFTVTNSVNCTSVASAEAVVNARPGVPTVVINNPSTICSNQTTDLTLAAVTAGSDPNLTYTYWTDAEATSEYATPEAAPAGTYYIKGTSTAGYYAIKQVVVTADELPVPNAGPDQVLDYVFGTTLVAEIPEVGTGIWALVSGTGSIFNSTAPSTEVSGLSVGENIFSWTVTNGACDPVSDNVSIIVNKLIIPTLITPNQDGRNDYFVIRGLGTMGRTELVIFDRRGLKVYENSDYDNTWEGLDYNSNPLPEDTYFYIVKSESGVSVSGYIVVRR